jgi:hypothetical protein
VRVILARTLAGWTVVFWGLWVGSSGQSAKQGTNFVNGNETVKETGDLIGAWLDMIDRAKGEWVTVPDLKGLPDGQGVRHDSERWCALFCKPAADPHTAAAMPAIAIHRATPDTADIIRYDYAAGNMRLGLVETVDFVLLRVEHADIELLKLSQDDIPVAITSIAGMLLNKPSPVGPATGQAHAWAFPFTKPIQEGSRFSTGPSQDPHLMPSWTSRVDGGIRGGHLYFMCFKKRESGDGRLIMLNSHHWFDGQAWAPYKSERRQSP